MSKCRTSLTDVSSGPAERYSNSLREMGKGRGMVSSRDKSCVYASRCWWCSQPARCRERRNAGTSHYHTQACSRRLLEQRSNGSTMVDDIEEVKTIYSARRRRSERRVKMVKGQYETTLTGCLVASCLSTVGTNVVVWWSVGGTARHAIPHLRILSAA